MWVPVAVRRVANCYTPFTLLYLLTYTRLTALFPGLPGWAGTRKAKPIWILLKQETVSGSGISWAICKSASRSRQITMPVLRHSKFFTGRMPFLPPNQQRQSTEGRLADKYNQSASLVDTSVLWSLYVCLSQLWAVLKRLNRSKCRFWHMTWGPWEPCIIWGPVSP